MERTTSVALAADKPYVKALNAVAARFGVRQADIVRDALDKVYGKEITEQLIFFANSDQQFGHLHNDSPEPVKG